ncbi:O-antigen ligase family protein [Vibrio cyclitrophicus]
MNKLLVSMSLCILLAFSTTGEIGGLNIFYITMPLFIAAQFIVFYNEFDVSLLVSSLFLSSLFIFLGIINQSYWEYQVWVLKMFFLALAIGIFYSIVVRGKFRSLSQIRAPLLLLTILLALFLTGGYVHYTIYGRSAFIFGPNVLYRLYGFLFFLASFLTYRLVSNRTYIRLFFLILSVFGVFITGSRGGVPVIVLMILCFYIDLPIFKKKLTNIIFLVSLIFPIILYFVLKLESLNLRIFAFDDIDGASLGSRFLAFHDALSNFTKYFFSLGMSSQDYFNILNYGYPHNISVELLVYYGGIGSFFAISLLASIFIFSRRALVDENFRFLYFCFLCFLVSSSFSGDMIHNFPTISFFLCMLVYYFKSDSKKLKY